MKKFRPSLLLAGRVCLVLILFLSAMQKLRYPGGSAQYMAGLGMPGASEALALAFGLFETVAALAILVGWRSRIAALAIVVYLVPVTWYTHLAIVYAAADAIVRDQETYQVLKNISMIGGLLILAASGPGEHSLEKK